MFFLHGTPFHREEVQVTNDRGFQLACSHFLPVAEKRMPCVVYVHGHGSCRIEACQILPAMLPLGVSVFCFDCTGAGRSEGDYCTAGYYEERDLKAVLEHLRGLPRVSSIALWGRSSGAVACILRAAQDPQVAAVMLDSPFSDFRLQLEEAIGNRLHMPEFMLHPIVNRIRDDILARSGLDVNEHRPVEVAPRSKTPAFFVAGVDDEIVAHHHTEKLFFAWGGSKKKIATFRGFHNSRRPRWLMDMAAEFLMEFLIIHEGETRRSFSNIRASTAPKPVALDGQYQDVEEENLEDSTWVEIDLDLVLDLQAQQKEEDPDVDEAIATIVTAKDEAEPETCSINLHAALSKGIAGLVKCMRTETQVIPEPLPCEARIWTVEAL